MISLNFFFSLNLSISLYCIIKMFELFGNRFFLMRCNRRSSNWEDYWRILFDLVCLNRKVFLCAVFLTSSDEFLYAVLFNVSKLCLFSLKSSGEFFRCLNFVEGRRAASEERVCEGFAWIDLKFKWIIGGLHL